MSNRIAVAIALASIGAAAFAWSQRPDDELLEAKAPTTQPAMISGASSQTAERGRAVPANGARTSPSQAAPAAGRPQPSSKWATVTVIDEEDPPMPRWVASSTPGARLSSPLPADEGARVRLVRDIQHELRRVGCYDGEASGWWSANTKRAMKAFTERVNATLPVEEADYILLSLVQGHKGIACGKGCPAGQLAAADGRCVPRALMTQRNAGRKAGATRPESEPARAIAPLHDQHAGAPRETLPGRMAVGAPIAGASERAEIALEEARRLQRQGVPGEASSAGQGVPASGAATLSAASANPSVPQSAEAQAGQSPRRAERPAQSSNQYQARKRSTRELLAATLRNAP
jgi:hypothetical protein